MTSHRLTARILAVVTAGVLGAAGLAVAVAQPAAAYLGESVTTLTLDPSGSMTYPTLLTARVTVRDDSGSCDTPIFPDCDEPAGRIRFYDNGVQIADVDLEPGTDGYATSYLYHEVGILDVGTHTITALFSGNFDDSSASATVNVSKGDCGMTLSQDKAQTTEGEAVTFLVTPDFFEPGEVLTFFDDFSRQLGEATVKWDGWVNVWAEWTTSSLPLGTTEVHAFWMGGHNYHPCISNAVAHTVVRVDTPPVAEDDAAWTMLDQPVVIDVLGNDVNTENDPLTVSVATPPANGQAVVNADRTISYTPNPGFVGPMDTFEYRITEPSGRSDAATVSVLVVCLISRADSYPVAHNTALTIADPGVLANDEHACDPAAGVRVVDPPRHGTVELRPSGGFTYTPNRGYSGTDSFNYLFIDRLLQGPKVSVTLSVAEAPPNMPPTATDATLSLVEDTPTAVTLAGTDPEGDQLTYSVTRGPAHGTLSGTGSNLTYIPAANYVGTDSFVFQVDDGRGGTDSGTVGVTVTAAPMVGTRLEAMGGTRAMAPRDMTFEDLRARITRNDTGAAVGGQHVVFTVDGTVVCTAVTTATGEATCSSGPFPKNSLHPAAGYTATYAGDGFDLLGASASAILATRGGG
jgi:hypothetical protein